MTDGLPNERLVLDAGTALHLAVESHWSGTSEAKRSLNL